MAKLLINRREFSIGATALLASLSNFSSFAGSKIKVAGIYTCLLYTSDAADE